MRITASVKGLATGGKDVVVVPVRAGDMADYDRKAISTTSASYKAAGKMTGGKLLEQLHRQGFKGAPGETFYFPLRGQPNGVLAVGFADGESEDETLRSLRALMAVAGAKTRAHGSSALTLLGMDLKLGKTAAQLAVLEPVLQANFDFSLKREPNFAPKIDALHVVGLSKIADKTIRHAKAIVDGWSYASTLALNPGNITNPGSMALSIQEEFEGLDGVSVIVRDYPWLVQHGWGGVVEVGKGSDFKPCVVEVRYTPSSGSDEQPIGLVGKGITFDTGGDYMKPHPHQDLMKGDMGGAACMVGAMRAVAALKPKRSVVAVLGLAENKSGSGSYRNSDVNRRISAYVAL